MTDDPRRVTESQVTLAALLNLVRLLAAELVAGAHRHEVEELIQAIEHKVDRTPLSAAIDQRTARVGIIRAKSLLRSVYKRIRQQAKEARAADAARVEGAGQGVQRRLLN
jgi:hypothetical protein